MKVDSKLKEQINDILSEWNPLDVPAFIASEEYMNYVDSIINIGRNINALRRYFISLIIDRLGLEYDPSNLEQINSIENVIEKVMNTLLERGEKSLYDETGGEWRIHKPDKYHPKMHWDHRPPATPENPYPNWEDIPID